MNNFNLLLLVVGLLTWSSYSYIAFEFVGPMTASNFNCLVSSVPNGIPVPILRVYQSSKSPAGIDPNALQTLTNL